MGNVTATVGDKLVLNWHGTASQRDGVLQMLPVIGERMMPGVELGSFADAMIANIYDDGMSPDNDTSNMQTIAMLWRIFTTRLDDGTYGDLIDHTNMHATFELHEQPNDQFKITWKISVMRVRDVGPPSVGAPGAVKGLGAMTPSELAGAPISRLIDIRHELTELIKQNLYGGGSKTEGQAALIARNSFDDFVFNTTDKMLVKGSVDDLRPLLRGIILENYSELLSILDDYARRFGDGRNAIKQGMLAIVADPDVLGRFNADQQAKIQAIATGTSFLAKSRFDQLHLSIRTEAGNSWAWRESQAARD